MQSTFACKEMLSIRGPQLDESIYIPHHDEGAADEGRGALGGVDGHGGRLGPDAEPEHEARGEEVAPGVRHAGPDAREEGERRGQEDGPAPAEVVVQRVREPAAEYGAAELEGGLVEK